MIILGIDTSCDDTCIALLRIKTGKLEILSNVVSSQAKLHAKYGGVYPFLAKREHQKNLPIVLKKATKGIDISKVDLIGVTIGPGLEPCLWQGINFAKDLAKKLKRPLIPVNHLEAHIIANFIDRSEVKVGDEGKPEGVNFIDRENSKLFPAVCLVVSGGHTVLVLMKNIGKYKLIGQTRDDAAGECFDKVARILGLGYPGGPAIGVLAAKVKSEIKLPRPMMYTKDYDFSFSGLKTAVLYDFKKHSLKVRKSKKYIQAMCTEIQQAIIDVLIHKTLKAAKDFKVKSIMLGGGVAANEELRKQFKEACLRWTPATHYPLAYLVPPELLCTDNAAMVAATAFFHKKERVDLSEIKANANLKI